MTPATRQNRAPLSCVALAWPRTDQLIRLACGERAGPSNRFAVPAGTRWLVSRPLHWASGYENHRSEVIHRGSAAPPWDLPGAGGQQRAAAGGGGGAPFILSQGFVWGGLLGFAYRPGGATL